jgi:tRNA pseudouridine55 synthase
MKEGIIIVNKPKGFTSHQVVERIRKILGIKRVGHTGTLDPLATGVLLILVGKTTRFFRRFLSYDKEYIATITLGKLTDTGDIWGKILKETEVPSLNKSIIEDVFKEFIGEIEQIPPMFSALKYKGRRLYQLARLGIEVPRKIRKVFIKELRLLDFKDNQIKFYVRCSTGTYIRKLAIDIAEKLNCVGCISEITRIGIGPYRLEEAVDISNIDENCILPFKEFI